MKIIKKLSIYASLTNRLMFPKNEDFFIQKYVEHNLTPEQQLIKFGYSNKSHPSILTTCLGFLGIILGASWYFYLIQLEKNEKTVRYKYRILQKQNPSLILRFRAILFEIGDYSMSRAYPKELLNQNKKVDRTTQATIRTHQYRNYMKKKDGKFDFLQIGVMDKFPYPAPEEE